MAFRNYLRLLRHKSTRRLIPGLLHNRFHAERVPDFKRIPIIINNFNRLDYPLRLIESLTRRGYTNIWIIDNHSTYPPLLKWYEECPYNVIRLKENVGYLAFIETEIHRMFADRYYVYTDPDVVPSEECPDDFLEYFYKLLQRYPEAVKVGFGLKIDDLPDCFANKKHVIDWESRFWTKPLAPDVYDADIDTTFALHRPNAPIGAGGRGLRIRTGGVYTARHLPWYVDTVAPSEEELYYQNTCKTSSHWTARAKKLEGNMVTVCVATYNQERWIGDALRGALEQQTDFPFEVLVSDDASTDGTLAVCRDFERRYPGRVRVLSSERNLGMLANYEKLFRAADGRYIALCDGDDYWTDPQKLQRQVDFMESTPGYGLCFAKARTYWTESESFRAEIGQPYQHLRDLVRICYVPALTALFRTSLVRDYLDDPEMGEIRKACPVTADYPLWLYIGLHAGIHFEDRTVAVFRVFPNSGSHHEDPEKSVRFYWTIWRTADRFIPLYGEKYHWKKPERFFFRLRLRQAIRDWCRPDAPSLLLEVARYYFRLLPATDMKKYVIYFRYRLKHLLWPRRK